MNEDDFEGTIVLEKLAALELVDEFFEAVDSDDIREVISLLRQAQIDDETIGVVIQKIKED